MKIQGKSYRTIWENQAGQVSVIDQRMLPHVFKTMELHTWQDAADAIRNMLVRGAPLIGITAAYALYLAVRNATNDNWLYEFQQATEGLKATRPTAVNLNWAIRQQVSRVNASMPAGDVSGALLAGARQLADDDVESCRKIGQFGLSLIRKLASKTPGKPLNILTHCNAGWLGCIDWGTATAPIYQAHAEGIPLHVWVDETRPRWQGAKLTAFELGQEGIPYTVITDNAGGLLMQAGRVDICIVGTDRTLRNGDVANKIGTYLKALAAHDNGIPFYVALPSSSIDWTTEKGSDIIIEERNTDEVHWVSGQSQLGSDRVRITPENAKALNPGFDITPARLIKGLITERGICDASEVGLRTLFPEAGKL